MAEQEQEHAAQGSGATGGDDNGRSPTTASAGNAKKRLLPMELRRRRRAAKLQITSERNVETIAAADIISGLDSEQQSEDAKRAVQNTAVHSEDGGPTNRNTPESHVVAETSISSTADATTNATASSSAARKTPTMNQLLASWSMPDRKRQRMMQQDSLIDVPMVMKLDSFPMDITPKAKVVITMPFPFPFSRPSAATSTTAICSLPAGLQTSHGEHESVDIQWLRATHHFVHPASPLPPSLNVTNDTQIEESEFYVQRFRTWQDSFRHAYFAFRKSESDTLYLRCADFVVCFYTSSRHVSNLQATPASLVDLCNAYVDGSGDNGFKGISTKGSRRRLCAVVSQSTARLRKDLQRRSVEFTVPFNARAMKRTVTDFSALEEELVAFPAQSQSRDVSATPTFGVHGADSLLHFHGHLSVHGLYESLLNRKPFSNQDVPEIITRYPFAHASIRPLSVRYMGRMASTFSTKEANGNGQATPEMFRVEVSGFCAPAAVAEMTRCLTVGGGHMQYASRLNSNEGSIKIVMETIPTAERLNAVYLNGSDITSVKTVLQERELWKQKLSFAKRRIASVTCHAIGDQLEIEMTAR